MPRILINYKLQYKNGYIDDSAISMEDTDFDGIPDENDNCINVPNPKQEDPDGDGVGDGCDNCRFTFNPDQSDSDKDGKGDACPLLKITD